VHVPAPPPRGGGTFPCPNVDPPLDSPLRVSYKKKIASKQQGLLHGSSSLLSSLGESSDGARIIEQIGSAAGPKVLW